MRKMLIVAVDLKPTMLCRVVVQMKAMPTKMEKFKTANELVTSLPVSQIIPSMTMFMRSPSSSVELICCIIYSRTWIDS